MSQRSLHSPTSRKRLGQFGYYYWQSVVIGAVDSVVNVLKETEVDKIRCGKNHFAALGVDFREVSSAAEV